MSYNPGLFVLIFKLKTTQESLVNFNQITSTQQQQQQLIKSSKMRDNCNFEIISYLYQLLNGIYIDLSSKNLFSTYPKTCTGQFRMLVSREKYLWALSIPSKQFC